MVKANPFRFSTKYQDDETDLLYYGYRYYDPSLGRWLNCDPAEEQGGSNLYCLGSNDPIGNVDRNGLDAVSFIYRIQLWLSGPPKPENAYVYGFEGIVGSAPPLVRLGQFDAWTFDMMRSHIVEMDRDRMRAALRLFCADRDSSAHSGWYPGDGVSVELGNELKEIPWYVYPWKYWIPDMFSNPTAAYVGSWTSGTIKAIKIDCCGRHANVHFHALNRSGIASATHLPPAFGKYGASILPDNLFGTDGPLHTISQEFDWDEEIRF